MERDSFAGNARAPSQEHQHVDDLVKKCILDKKAVNGTYSGRFHLHLLVFITTHGSGYDTQTHIYQTRYNVKRLCNLAASRAYFISSLGHFLKCVFSPMDSTSAMIHDIKKLLLPRA